MLFAVALFSLCMDITIPENYAFNLAGAIALGVALFPMQWSACDKAKQKFYHRLCRTLDCLTIGFPTLAFVSTFVASIIVAGSTEVTHGERTNSGAVFFERADAVKAGLSFGFGEHAIQRRVTDECATQCVTDSPNHCRSFPGFGIPVSHLVPRIRAPACIHPRTREPLKTKHIMITTDTDGRALRS